MGNFICKNILTEKNMQLVIWFIKNNNYFPKKKENLEINKSYKWLSKKNKKKINLQFVNVFEKYYQVKKNKWEHMYLIISYKIKNKMTLEDNEIKWINKNKNNFKSNKFPFENNNDLKNKWIILKQQL